MLPPYSPFGKLMRFCFKNLLDPLRADVNSHIPKQNPYLFEGTEWPWDTQKLHQVFARAQHVQVTNNNTDAVPPSPHPGGGTISGNSTPARRKSIAMPSFSLGLGYGPFMSSQAFPLDLPPVRPPRPEGTRILRIAKTGILGRKGM